VPDFEEWLVSWFQQTTNNVLNKGRLQQGLGLLKRYCSYSSFVFLMHGACSPVLLCGTPSKNNNLTHCYLELVNKHRGRGTKCRVALPAALNQGGVSRARHCFDHFQARAQRCCRCFLRYQLCVCECVCKTTHTHTHTHTHTPRKTITHTPPSHTPLTPGTQASTHKCTPGRVRDQRGVHQQSCTCREDVSDAHLVKDLYRRFTSSQVPRSEC
jgi:hypothetical protein